MELIDILMFPLIISSVLLLFFFIVSLGICIYTICTGEYSILHRFGDIFQIYSNAWMANIYALLFIFGVSVLKYVVNIDMSDMAVGFLYGAGTSMCIWYIIWILDYNIKVKPLWVK